MNILSPFRTSRLLFWSFVLLAVVMVIAVALALRSFNREVSDMPDTLSPESKNVAQPSQDSANAQPTPEELEATMALNRRMLSGFVSEVIAKEGASEKWITLLVALPEAASIDTFKAGSEQSISVKTKEYAYRFYLGAETKGAGDIQGGETVNVSFFGEPSEKDYVGAETIAIREK